MTDKRARGTFRLTAPMIQGLALAVVILSAGVVAVWLLAGQLRGPLVSARAVRTESVPSTTGPSPEATAAAPIGGTISGSSANEASSHAVPGSDPSAVPTLAGPESTGIVIAWQPSHQGDTGVNGWEEYVICGDIADRAMKALPEYGHVKAWDTSHGLTGSNNYKPQPKNTPAFDAELAMATAAGATLFVSIHNDGAAPSGVLGEYMPGDENGRRLCESLVDSLTSGTGLPDRGLREVRLYSLEAPKNPAEYKCLLEIGDNAADREFLENPANRELIAQALAEGVRGFMASE